MQHYQQSIVRSIYFSLGVALFIESCEDLSCLSGIFIYILLYTWGLGTKH